VSFFFLKKKFNLSIDIKEGSNIPSVMWFESRGPYKPHYTWKQSFHLELRCQHAAASCLPYWFKFFQQAELQFKLDSVVASSVLMWN
jgi:hypothetical protein